MDKIFLPVLCFCLILTSVACTPTVNQRGNLLEDRQIEQVVPNIHTRSDVLRILGSPTTTAPFDPNLWYYIGQETEKRGILDPDVKKETIVLVSFDESGIVRSLTKPDRERLEIPIERKKTATHGNDMSVMQQLLGNLGRFNPQEGNP